MLLTTLRSRCLGHTSAAAATAAAAADAAVSSHVVSLATALLRPALREREEPRRAAHASGMIKALVTRESCTHLTPGELPRLHLPRFCSRGPINTNFRSSCTTKQSENCLLIFRAACTAARGADKSNMATTAQLTTLEREASSLPARGFFNLALSTYTCPA